MLSNEPGRSGPAMACTDCGAELKGGFQFCPECGTPVHTSYDAGEPAPTVMDHPTAFRDPSWLLVVVEGAEVGASFPLGDRLVIGRAKECDVILADVKASRRHAAVEQTSAGGYELIDLGSSNGTFVQEERIERVVLRPGVVFRIGDTRLSVAPAFNACPNCFQPVEPEAEFCGNCGQRVGIRQGADLELLAAEIEARAAGGAAPPGTELQAHPVVAAPAEPGPVRPEAGARMIDGSPPPRRSSGRWLAIGCLFLGTILVASVCCAALVPLLEGSF